MDEATGDWLIPYTCSGFPPCIPVTIETADFKIDTTGTYHGLTLKSVTVSECLSVTDVSV